MNELLTTGEMIDKLELGEVAEDKGKVMKAYWEFDDDWNTEILKFVVDNDNGVYNFVQIEDKNRKWHILPNYVSFEEAMKALQNAKAVYFHDGDWVTRVVYGSYLEDMEMSGYTFAQLINGKWTIKDDSDV